MPALRLICLFQLCTLIELGLGIAAAGDVVPYLKFYRVNWKVSV